MKTKKYLTLKQRMLIDDLLEGQMDEDATLRKLKIKRDTYCRWLNKDNFKEQLMWRIAALNRHCELIVARCASLATAKLVELTGSEKAETARKACLDIIKLPKQCGFAPSADAAGAGKTDSSVQVQTLPADKAQRILATLADDANTGNIDNQ